MNKLKIFLKIFLIFKGPTLITLNDMWRMVWEQRSYSIVMVTSLVELEKVYKYIFTALSFYVLQYWYYLYIVLLHV